MFRAVTSGCALLRARRQFIVKDRSSFERRRRWAGLVPTIYFVLSAMIFAGTANAAGARDVNDSFSALRDYVQLISASGKAVGSPDQNSCIVDPKL